VPMPSIATRGNCCEDQRITDTPPFPVMEPTPASSLQRERVLITVLTYPHPSESYDELVCTAGVTPRGEWVRLYPIDYRYRPREQQFHKFQWIDVDLEARGAGNDIRKESRRPQLSSIQLVGRPIPTDDNWRGRCEIVDALHHSTMSELESRYDSDKTSLGVLRPVKVLDVVVEPAEKEWKGTWKDLHNQLRLFEAPPKKLEKLPYKWSYVFTCADRSEPYTRMIEDWELGVLFLKLRDEHGEERAAQMVRDRYLNVLAGADRDIRFFMGTRFPYTPG
jgi:hypothetical protein